MAKIGKLKFCNISDMSSDDVLYACISHQVNDKIQLFIELEQKLNLPGYFGRNWDALDECLCDFHWIKAHKIVIAHKVLPKLPEDDFKLYLDVLIFAIESWENSEEHSLEIQFNKYDEVYIQSLVTG